MFIWYLPKTGVSPYSVGVFIQNVGFSGKNLNLKLGYYTSGSHRSRGRGLGEGRGPGGLSPGCVFEERVTCETAQLPVLYTVGNKCAPVCVFVQQILTAILQSVTGNQFQKPFF